jgi:hypothetical protein
MAPIHAAKSTLRVPWAPTFHSGIANHIEGSQPANPRTLNNAERPKSSPFEHSLAKADISLFHSQDWGIAFSRIQKFEEFPLIVGAQRRAYAHMTNNGS